MSGHDEDFAIIVLAVCMLVCAGWLLYLDARAHGVLP